MKYIKTYEKVSDLPSETNDFIDYVLSVYGENGYFREYFDGKLTIDVVKKYVNDYIKKRVEMFMWDGGDTFDREIFRDVLLFKLGLVKNIGELEHNIKPYLTDLEIDANNYNL